MGMNTLILLFAAIAVATLITKYLLARKPAATAVKKPPVYTYGRRDFLMTRSENDFFSVLKDLLQDRY